MVELAIDGNPAFEIDRLELDRPGPSWTVDTLEVLDARERAGGNEPDLWFILSVEQLLKLPQHDEVACPACGAAPPAAPIWKCPCGAEFDTFATRATCPQCGRRFESTACPHCGRHFPIEQWPGVPAVPVAT